MVLCFKISLQIKHSVWHMVRSQQMSQIAGKGGGGVEEEKRDQTIQCRLASGSRT